MDGRHGGLVGSEECRATGKLSEKLKHGLTPSWRHMLVIPHRETASASESKAARPSLAVQESGGPPDQYGAKTGGPGESCSLSVGRLLDQEIVLTSDRAHTRIMHPLQSCTPANCATRENPNAEMTGRRLTSWPLHGNSTAANKNRLLLAESCLGIPRPRPNLMNS